jgi:hypothetical protein
MVGAAEVDSATHNHNVDDRDAAAVRFCQSLEANTMEWIEEARRAHTD